MAAAARSQANQCWERASEDELGDLAGDAEGRAGKPAAADFKQLKILLRMLEDNIAKAVPPVRPARLLAVASPDGTDSRALRRAPAPRTGLTFCLICCVG